MTRTEGDIAEAAPDMWEPVRHFEEVIRQADADARRIAALDDPSQRDLDCALTRGAEAAYARTLAYREVRLVQDEDEAVRISACPEANRMDVLCANWRRDSTRDALRVVRLAAGTVELPPRPCTCATCSELRNRRMSVTVDAEMEADWEADRAGMR